MASGARPYPQRYARSTDLPPPSPVAQQASLGERLYQHQQQLLAKSSSFGSYNRQQQQQRSTSQYQSNDVSLQQLDEQVDEVMAWTHRNLQGTIDEGNHHQQHQHDDSDINSSFRIETPSPVNVKELKRQLWNDQEVLQVPSTSVARSDHCYASDSEYHQKSRERHGEETQQALSPARHVSTRRSFQETITKQTRATDPPVSSQHRLLSSRYARSLSPARRKKQQQQQPLAIAQRNNFHASTPATVASISEQPKTLPYAASAVSDTSSGAGIFHSKFYEAALAARMGRKIASNRSFDEHQQPLGIHQPKPSQHVPRRDETSTRPPDTQRVAEMDQQQQQQQHRRSSHDAKHPRSLVERRSFQQETIVPQSHDEAPEELNVPETNIGRSASFSSSQYGGEQLSSRGRSMEPPRRAGRGKQPSPLIQDRIRSLSQDSTLRYETMEYDGNLHGKSATNSPGSDPRDDAFEATIGMFGSEDGSKNTPVFATYATAMSSRQQPAVLNDSSGVLGAHKETGQVAAYWQRRNSSTRPDGFVESPVMHHPNVYPHQEEAPAAPQSPSGNKVKMAQLMAKLNSVNRSNPELALAEIDKILRQESQMAAPFASDAKGLHDEGNMDDDNDDDDSDVSSITNPTYQGSCKPYFDRIRVVSPHGDKTSQQNQSPAMQDPPPSKLPFNPSTSSFRRPRPSHLQNYAIMPTTSQDFASPGGFDTKSRADAERKHSRNSAPLSHSSDFQDSNVFSNSFMENPFDEYASVQDPTQKPKDVKISGAPFSSAEVAEGQAKASKASRKPSPTEQVNITSGDHHKTATSRDLSITKGRSKSGKLEKFISDKEALANQIRVWDSLSNGVSKSESKKTVSESQVGFPSEHTVSMPRPPNQSSRRHPWDGKLPSRLESVNMRDTSMDEAIGIETEMTVRGEIYETGIVTYRKQSENQKETESIDHPMMENNHFAAGRQNIKCRAEDYLPVDPVYHIDNKVDEEKKVADAEAAEMNFPDILLEAVNSDTRDEEVPSDINLMRNVTKSPDGALQFSPTSQPYYENPQKAQRAPKEPNEEQESSWVSMPATTFFSEFKTLNPFADSDHAKEPAQSKKQLSLPSKSTTSVVEMGNKSTSERKAARSPKASTVFSGKSDLPETNGPKRSSSLVKRDFNRASGALPRGRRDGPPNAGPVDIDTFDDFGNSPMNQSVEQAEIEVSLMELQAINRKIQTDKDGVAASRTGARSLACQTVGNNEGQARSRDKKKGFLRAFIERKKKKAAGSATVGHAASAASVTAHSLSLESRGARSVPVSASSAPATPEIRLMPPPPGVMDRRALTPNRGRRGQRTFKASSRRARSNSLERFRTPSMAQKFNRVMKLYDDET
jgi:hypothetical protein